ncbi:MAG: glycosyltransferase family 4 protein [Cyclobacteriaceae bacterium]|nr:glycosyltransferase family 4 protein [Cyclobacteriaceae bacterium]
MTHSVLFVNDHCFFKEGEAYYSQGGLPARVWGRYLEHFDSLEVVARKSPKRDAVMALSSRDRVSFSLSDFYTRPNDEITYQKKIDAHLKSRIEISRAVIVRLPSILGFRAISICKKLKKPYAIEVVGCPRDTYWNYGSVFGKILSPIVFYRMKHAIFDCNFTVYVTKNFLQQRYPSNRPSVNISNVVIKKTLPSVLELHKELLNRSKKRMRLGMIGAIDTRYKGYDVLFRALSIIKTEVPDFELLLVGGGGSKRVDRLSKKYGLVSNVKVIGVVSSGDEVNRFLDTLDLYLHPSLTEGLPRAMIEAMSRGCPILSSDAGGIPELINQRYQHKAGNYKQLARQLARILNDRNELTSMSKENFENAKMYTQEVLSVKLSEFWKKFSVEAKREEQ